jgi:hypothetical protein
MKGKGFGGSGAGGLGEPPVFCGVSDEPPPNLWSSNRVDCVTKLS